MLFKRFYDEPLAQASFLLADTTAREAIVVDPNRDIEAYVRAAAVEKVKIVAVTETHIHADYLSGTRELARRVHATAYVSDEGDADWKYGWADEPNVKRVRNGDAIRAGRVRLDVLATPGHTPDSLSYLVGDRVLTGDALLIRGAGRTDFQNGDAGALYDSINNVLFALPDETFVYPGHDYTGRTCSTIGEERRHNPRIAGKTREAFVELMSKLVLPRPHKMDLAVPANLACGRREPQAS